MIQGYVINKGLRYYIDMSLILNPIKEYLIDYNFLISDFECNWYPDKRISYDVDFIFIPANELLEIVNANDIQFIWGVFSAIPKQIELDEVLKYELPCAENSSMTCGNLRFLHPLAKTELIAVDSSFVEIVSKDRNIITSIEKQFPRDMYSKNS